jgi:DNA-binding beta-propeller fold protein YncE
MDRHKQTALAVAIVALSVTSIVVAQPATPGTLQLERKLSLGDVNGRIDHMAFDLMHHRLFVAELGNDSVSVIDLDAQKVLHRLSNLKEPQGVAYVESNDSLYVANGGDGSVRVFQGPEYVPVGRIEFGGDADNLRVDLTANRLFVGYGSGAIGTIDLRSNKKIESFPLNAHPESFQLDAKTRQIFVNLPNKRRIALIDASTGKQRASWSVRYGGNFPMALDHERQRVLVVFRSPPKFIAFNWQTGDVLSEIDTCGDADDVFLDTNRKQVYITCGAGFIDVLRAEDSKYSHLARVPTVAGARTGLFVPDMGRLFLGVRAQQKEPASIWIYRVAP